MSTLPAPGSPLLSVRGLGKSFPGQVALAGVDLDVHAGEIVAVVGQNGSGKSTLIKVLTGLYEPDPGSEISVRLADGRQVDGAEARGAIHVIHQDLGLIPMLSAVENLDLDGPAGRRGWLPNRRRHERAAAERLLRRFGPSFDVEAPVESLTPPERTIVAIVKALSGWTHPEQVLLLDEPTAALHGAEVERLFTAVRQLAADRAGIVFISHRLDEVLDLADRVVTLRGGRVTADVGVDELDHRQLITLITGRTLDDVPPPPGAVAQEPVLELSGVVGEGVRDVDLTLRPGEVLGVAGLLGSGREHLAGILFGAQPRLAGEVRLDGRPLAPNRPMDAVRRGVGYVPADRHADGGILSMSARENLTLTRLSTLRGRLGSLSRRREVAEATDWVRRVELDPPDPERELELFSGGNQQKVVLAKWLRNQPRLFLLDEPTQGVDVGAKQAVYGLVHAAAREGAGVIVSSSDSAELAAICDRVIVMRDGAVCSQLSGQEITEARIVAESLGLVTDPSLPREEIDQHV